MVRETQRSEYHNVETNKKLSDGGEAAAPSHDLSMIAMCSKSRRIRRRKKPFLALKGLWIFSVCAANTAQAKREYLHIISILR